MPLLENGIVMWSGNLIDIPNNWKLCDGTNGTPDLRNKFIIGAGNLYSFETAGGSKNTTLVSHTHTMSGNSGSNAFNHTHTINIESSTIGTANTTFGVSFTNVDSSSSGAHAHSVTLSQAGSGETGINKNLPPYYALAFIMQITE